MTEIKQCEEAPYSYRNFKYIHQSTQTKAGIIFQVAMTHFEYTQKLEFLKHLIKLRQAGTPQQLADKLDTSERTALRMIQHLKDHNYPIRFNRFRKGYEIVDQ